MSENEDRYETINIIIRSRSNEEGESWFDVIHDFIAESCEPILDENGDQYDCTCGLISGGGFTGTLEGCYDHQRISEKWATVEAADLKKILLKVSYMGLNDEEREAFDRLKEEAYWHDNFQAWLDSIPDEEEEEEFELDEEVKPYFSDEPLPDSIVKGDW